MLALFERAATQVWGTHCWQNVRVYETTTIFPLKIPIRRRQDAFLAPAKITKIDRKNKFLYTYMCIESAKWCSMIIICGRLPSSSRHTNTQNSPKPSADAIRCRSNCQVDLQTIREKFTVNVTSKWRWISANNCESEEEKLIDWKSDCDREEKWICG